MGIDDESSHPELCSEAADGVTRASVRLFREPDAVTPPVRFDERGQETEPGQTGLRRVQRKPNPIATGRLQPLRLFSTLPNKVVGVNVVTSTIPKIDGSRDGFGVKFVLPVFGWG
jgi:hypothetical protein